jgi:hypothetical protein
MALAPLLLGLGHALTLTRTLTRRLFAPVNVAIPGRSRPIGTCDYHPVRVFSRFRSAAARCCLHACSAGMFCGLLGVIPLQLLTIRAIRRTGPQPLPGIDLGLLHPPAQRVGVDAQSSPTRRHAAVTLPASCAMSSTRRIARSPSLGIRSVSRDCCYPGGQLGLAVGGHLDPNLPAGDREEAWHGHHITCPSSLVDGRPRCTKLRFRSQNRAQAGPDTSAEDLSVIGPNGVGCCGLAGC